MVSRPDEQEAQRLAYLATRRLIGVRDPEAAQRIVLDFLTAVGASTAPASEDRAGTIPVDVCVSGGESILPVCADPAVADLVTRYALPLVMDARAVLDWHRSSDRLALQATRDPLTNLWNRRSFTLALDRVRSTDAVALIDLDHFKRVNDSHGHSAGDELLVAFARFLSDSVPADAIVGRLGGEEFGLVLPLTCRDDARALLARLQVDWVAIAPYPVTFSAGVTQVGLEERPRIGRDALHRADELMYEAKVAGRNLVR